MEKVTTPQQRITGSSCHSSEHRRVTVLTMRMFHLEMNTASRLSPRIITQKSFKVSFVTLSLQSRNGDRNRVPMVADPCLHKVNGGQVQHGSRSPPSEIGENKQIKPGLVFCQSRKLRCHMTKTRRASSSLKASSLIVSIHLRRFQRAIVEFTPHDSECISYRENKTNSCSTRYFHLSSRSPLRSIITPTLTKTGTLAQKRLARGLQLNINEAIALIASQLQERIRDGHHSVAELMAHGKNLLGRRHVLPGVPPRIRDIQVEGTFADGSVLCDLV